MVFDGFFADKEIFANVLIALAFGHQTKHLSLTPGKRIIVTRDKLDARFLHRSFSHSPCLVEISHPAQLVNQLTRNFRMNECMPLADRTDSIDQ
ncbi:hypothetical protein D3C73_1351690 [compost metagenome]